MGLAHADGVLRGLGVRDRRRCRRDRHRRRSRDHDRAARAADRAPGEDGRAGGRGRPPADGRAARHRPDQRLGRADPARRPVAAEGGGREMTVTFAAISPHTYWVIALSIGLVAAAGRGGPADRARRDRRQHREVGERAARDRGQGRRQHLEHSPARGDGSGPRPDRRRGRRPGRLHERAHRRVR